MKDNFKDSIILPKGVRKISKKYFGKCAICKKQGELSKEHIPPRSAFNKGRYKVANGLDILKSKGLPWVDNENVNSKIIQGGFATYSLCHDCNNKTGLYYANAYKEFVYALHSVLVSSSYKANDLIKIRIDKIKPLNIFKQIVSMFNSINPSLFTKQGFDIEKFLLEKEEATFCNNIYFYIFLTENGVVIPLQAKALINKPSYLLILSEITHYPLGIIMSIDSKLEAESCCINDFLNYDYDQEACLDLNLYFRERNLTFANDYRTKKELDILDDKKN